MEEVKINALYRLQRVLYLGSINHYVVHGITYWLLSSYD